MGKINILKQLCPPLLRKGLNVIRRKVIQQKPSSSLHNSGEQDLDVYWDPKMVEILETWGEGNVWTEIQLLLINCRGKVLDIACGTGKTMEILRDNSEITLHGCDISDALIQKAIERRFTKDQLDICDATNLPYKDNTFNYAYSIGSLEHFTEKGILKFISEAYRVSQIASFHMIPVSRSNKDEGWMKTLQSFHNNSIDWWTKKYKAVYKKVYVIDSSWSDPISTGKWFVCFKDGI